MSHREFIGSILGLSIITPYAILSIATPETFNFLLTITTAFQIMIVMGLLIWHKDFFKPIEKLEKERKDLKISHEANVMLYSFLAQKAFSENVISDDEFKDLIKNKTGKPDEYTK